MSNKYGDCLILIVEGNFEIELSKDAGRSIQQQDFKAEVTDLSKIGK